MINKIIKENNMNLTKILFGIMLVFFLFLVVFGNIFNQTRLFVLPGVYIERDYALPIAPKYVTNYIQIPINNYEDNVYENCSFEKPNKKIIVRMDDLGAWHYDTPVQNITDTLLTNNISLVVGVIPENIEKDPTFIKWLKSIKDNPNLEIALHGYKHEENEFLNLSYNESYDRISAGKLKLMKYLGIVPVTFIPPYNTYSENTIEALKQNGFKIMSPGNYGFFDKGELKIIGYNARTYNFDNYEFIPADKTLQDCETALNKTGYCIVMLHPQDYLVDPTPGVKRVINQQRYQEFLKLIDGLKVLEVKNNANFETFKDSLVC